MKKIVAATLGLVFAGTVAFASPSIDYTPGAVTAEFGGTIDSTFSGKITGISAAAKSGFKFGVTTGLGNGMALQYKEGHFKSEDLRAPWGNFIHGKSDLNELNLLYRISPNVSLVTGWLQNKISYSADIAEAKVSGMHIGLAGSKRLSDQSNLFASVVAGKDTLFWEAGVSNKIGKDTYLNVSYAVREFKNVDVIPSVLVPKEDYKLKGISCVVSTKL